MRCKRLTWENEGPGLFDIWLVCVKTQTNGSFARQLVSLLVDKEHCAAKHSSRQPTLGREGWVFRHIRLGTEMPFTFHAEFDETKIDFRMLRNSRENERISFSRLLARRVSPLVLRCPRRWRRRRGHGGRVAGAFYSVVFLNVRPWAVNFSLSVSAMFAVMSAR